MGLGGYSVKLFKLACDAFLLSTHEDISDVQLDAMEVLTPREFVVARRFAAGMSHKQIARELGVSHHTVRNQLAHLYRKLNLHDKASLAQYLSTNLGAH